MASARKLTKMAKLQRGV